jgi:hypothetical protein
MNAVEIEEAISALAERPFDAGEFPYAFLEGRQPAELQLDHLLAPFPVEWARQREALVDGIGAGQQSRKEREPAD